MATLKGTPVEFVDMHTVYKDKKPRVVWEYNTTSDYLTVWILYPEGNCAYQHNPTLKRNKVITLGRPDAEALLASLKEWERT